MSSACHATRPPRTAAKVTAVNTPVAPASDSPTGERNENREEYFPYGSPSDRRDARNRYRFIGVERDEDTGLCMTGPRTYDPVLGRFLQGEPEEGRWAAGWSPFEYGEGHPLRLVDPSGRAPGAVDEPPPPPPPEAPREEIAAAFRSGVFPGISQVEADLWAGAYLDPANVAAWGALIGHIQENLDLKGSTIERLALARYGEATALSGQGRHLEAGVGAAIASIEGTGASTLLGETFGKTIQKIGAYAALSWALGYVGGRLLGRGSPAPAPAPGGAATAEATTALVKSGPQYGAHVLDRMAERAITGRMVEKALEKGTRYWDPKNGVVNHVLRGGFANGQDLLVGQNPVTGKITTVIRGRNLVSPRFVPLE